MLLREKLQNSYRRNAVKLMRDSDSRLPTQKGPLFARFSLRQVRAFDYMRVQFRS